MEVRLTDKKLLLPLCYLHVPASGEVPWGEVVEGHHGEGHLKDLVAVVDLLWGEDPHPEGDLLQNEGLVHGPVHQQEGEDTVALALRNPASIADCQKIVYLALRRKLGEEKAQAV